MLPAEPSPQASEPRRPPVAVSERSILASARPASSVQELPSPPRSIRIAHSRLIRCVSLGLASGPAVVPLILILRYGVNMFFWDQWDPDIAGIFIKAYQHHLTFSDLEAQHSEHRLLLPRVAWLLLGPVTHWSVTAEMLLGWAIACGSSIGILWLIWRTSPPSKKQPPAAFSSTSIFSFRVIVLWFLSNLMIFAPTQWENWLWGISACNLMPPFFVIATVVAAASSLRPWPKTLLAIFIAALATYSSGNGMLAWPVSAPVLFFPFSIKTMRCRLVTWLAAAGLFVSLYFVGYHKPLHGGAHPYATSIWSVIQYVPLFVGSPFAYIDRSDQLLAANGVGYSMLTMYGCAIAYLASRFRHKGDERLLRSGIVWVMLGSFVIVSGTWAGIGRGSLSPSQALSSRYVSFSLYLPIGLIALAGLICDDLRGRKLSPAIKSWVDILPSALGALLIAGDLLCFPTAMDHVKETAQLRKEGKAGLLLMKSLPNNAALRQLVFSDITTQHGYPNILNKIGYIDPPLIESNRASDFQETDSNAMGGISGRLENLAQEGPDQLIVTGWAAMKSRQSPADAVFITCDNKVGQPIVSALAVFDATRGDVNRAWAGDFGRCGWEAQISASSLPRDLSSTSISAWALNVSTGKAFKLDGTTRLDLSAMQSLEH